MGNFTFEKCGEIEGLYLIQPKVFGDNRGYFMETYNYNDYGYVLYYKKLLYIRILTDMFDKSMTYVIRM